MEEEETQKNDSEMTCSEILFRALEDFNKSEAKSLVLIYINDKDELMLLRNTSNSQALGLCDYARESILRAIFGAD